MNKTVIEVQVRAVLPTSGGCAVFIGNNEKVFIIYVDQTVGSAITMFMRQITKERPLTHDLMGHLMTALGAKVDRVIINDLKNATYYARVIIRVQNELQQKKIIELDGRPSDCIAMAIQQNAPIYVSQRSGTNGRYDRRPAQDGGRGTETGIERKSESCSGGL
jgi:bifunctional DNase/RNase